MWPIVLKKARLRLILPRESCLAEVEKPKVLNRIEPAIRGTANPELLMIFIAQRQLQRQVVLVFEGRHRRQSTKVSIRIGES